MDIINYKIIECDRLSSQDVKILGIDADNKSSWTNIINPIQLKKGDQINLEQCIISQKGADSNSIEFNGENKNSIDDNFSLLEIGFYLNNNAVNTLGLPYGKETGDPVQITTKTEFDTSTYLTNSDGHNVPNSYYIKATYQHPISNPNYTNQGIKLDEFVSINPFQYIDNTKYVKIDPSYAGWGRDPNTGKRLFTKCKLMTECIPLKLKEGFLNPNSVADKLTLQLQRTLPAKDDIKTPKMNNGYDQEILADKKEVKQLIYNTNVNSNHDELKKLYTFNGYTYKSIYANFYHDDYGETRYNIDPIYSNLCVQNPYKYVFGVNLICETDVWIQNNLERNSDSADPLFGTDNNINPVDMRLYYPVFFWSNYLYNGEIDNNINNWDIYCPSSLSIDNNGDGPITGNILTLRTSLNYNDSLEFDRIYIGSSLNTSFTKALVFNENKNLIVIDQQPIMFAIDYPIVYQNGQPFDYKLIIMWNIVPTLSICDIWTNNKNGKNITITNKNFSNYNDINDGVIQLTSDELNINWYLSFTNKLFTQGTIINKNEHANSSPIANFTLSEDFTINITTLTNGYNLPNVGLSPNRLIWTDDQQTPILIKQFPTLQNVNIVWFNNTVFNYDFYITNRDGNPAIPEGHIYFAFNNRSEEGLCYGKWFVENNPNTSLEGYGTFELNSILGTITTTDSNTNPSIRVFTNGGETIYNFSDCNIKPSNISKIIPTGWTLLDDKKINALVNGTIVNNTKFFHLTTENSMPANYNGTSTIPSKNYNLINGDTATITTSQNIRLKNSTSRLVKHQVLITNIKLTWENIYIIEEWIKYNKIYNGNKTKKSEILKDNNNYYVNVDIGRTNDDLINTTQPNDTFPVVPAYLKDKSTMGISDGIDSDKNIGAVCPHTKADINNRQEIQIRATFFDKYYDENEVHYEGLFTNRYNEINQNTYGYASLVEEDLPTIKDKIDYLRKKNIGIIPLGGGLNIKSDGLEEVFTIGFLVHKNYVRNELLKIQNLTYFGFSPMFCDSPQLVPMSRFNSSGFQTGTAPSNGNDDIRNMANFINIGSVNPTITFNQNFSQYQLSDFHTPTYQNEYNSSADDAGKIVARLQDQTILFPSWFQNMPINSSIYNPPNTWGISNLGINDSQSGIFIHNIYGQKSNILNDVVDKDDTNAIEITPNNYYDCLWFKLGFTYYDLIPIKFLDNDFRNRFYDLYYNNVDNIEYRQLALKPFTTNSDIGISEAISTNIFGFDSQSPSNNQTSLIGKPRFGLGYNNNQEVALEVSSAFMSATSIPVQISTPYYRIYTNLPIHNLNYQNDGNNLSCVGLGLRNYASSSFYYSYAMSYNATITKDVTITEIKTEIRNIDGVVARNLGDKSSVIYKITQQQTIGSPQTPQEIELLQQINNELKENNKIETKENFFERLKLEQGEMQESKQNEMTTNLTEEQQAMENLIYNIKLKIIQKIVNNSIVNIKKGERPPRDVVNDTLRDIAKNLATYFYDNRDKLRNIENKLYNEGERAINSPSFKNFIKTLRGFMVNVEGELIRSNTPLPRGSFVIDDLGSRIILDTINNSITQKGKIPLTTELESLVSNLFQDSQNIKIIGELKRKEIINTIDKFNPLKVRYKLGEKNTKLPKNIEKFLKNELKIKEVDMKKIATNKNLKNLIQIYKQAQETIEPEQKYISLNSIFKILENMGINISMQKIQKTLGLIKKKQNQEDQQRVKTTETEKSNDDTSNTKKDDSNIKQDDSNIKQEKE
mgnify:CR=1 FL=1|tara:strand:- start:406 stop:5631 length:5226 start_codon:yes stop_codon:yes gene_type:complete